MKSKDLYSGIFSRHAEAYRERHRQIDSRGRNRALELLAVEPGERVVDLACGPGNVTRRLVSAGASVIGVDVAPGMLALASRDVPEADFALMDLERLGFSDAGFDAALCGHGLQFVPRLDMALCEARRILRPGGRLAASVPSRRGGRALDDVIGPIADRWLNPRPLPVDACDRSLVEDPDVFAASARAAGFGEARAERVETESHWQDPATYIGLQTSWWDMASRMEGVSPDRILAYTTELKTRLQERFGDGPFDTAGLDVVLYAVR